MLLDITQRRAFSLRLMTNFLMAISDEIVLLHNDVDVRCLIVRCDGRGGPRPRRLFEYLIMSSAMFLHRYHRRLPWPRSHRHTHQHTGIHHRTVEFFFHIFSYNVNPYVQYTHVKIREFNIFFVTYTCIFQSSDANIQSPSVKDFKVRKVAIKASKDVSRVNK